MKDFWMLSRWSDGSDGCCIVHWTDLCRWEADGWQLSKCLVKYAKDDGNECGHLTTLNTLAIQAHGKPLFPDVAAPASTSVIPPLVSPIPADIVKAATPQGGEEEEEEIEEADLVMICSHRDKPDGPACGRRLEPGAATCSQHSAKRRRHRRAKTKRHDKDDDEGPPRKKLAQ